MTETGFDTGSDRAERNEDERVAAQYEAWVYPEPVADMAEAVTSNGYFDLSDPSLVRRKFWPRRVEPEDLDILVAGCGANQAAALAFTNPTARVVGVDLSEASLRHEHQLKSKHGLDNLELHHLGLDRLRSLERDFDLVVCTGVLHHLPDPAAGLRGLEEVLGPHGVMSLMLYGRYPRVGVYMLQEVFRLLGLRQDETGLEVVKQTLGRIPDWHHINSYNAPDLGYDAGLVDTFLHPQDRAYTVTEVLDLVEASGLKFQGWLDNLDYAISAYIADEQHPVRQLVEELSPSDRWRAVELMGQSLARHFFLVCHVDRPDADHVLDFTGRAWLDYVPSLRRPITLLDRREYTSDGAPPTGSTGLMRSFQGIEFRGVQAELLAQVDGERTISRIIDAVFVEDAAQRMEVARAFFAGMAEWDHLLYEIPGPG